MEQLGLNYSTDQIIKVPIEIEVLDLLIMCCPYEIIKQYRVGKYKVDAYIPRLHLAIQIDEHGHAHYDAEEEKQYDTSLLRAMVAVDIYIKQQMTTHVFKDFMRQVRERHDASRGDFTHDVGKLLPARYSMNVLWNAQEIFTNYSFQNLHITLEYCAYFIDNRHDSTDQINQKRQNCLKKQSRRFEFTIQVKGRGEEEISKMFVCFRALVARENKETI